MILTIVGLLVTWIPKLVQAYEDLHAAFPGAGQVKKAGVLSTLGTITDLINQGLAVAGKSPLDKTQVLNNAALAIDDYVAVMNLTQEFVHSGK